MKPAPERIGGARVLRWTSIDDRHKPTGNCRHTVAGKVRGPAAGLAICRHDGEQAVYLFGCDEDWNVVTDTWHETLQDALKQAEFEYEGVTMTWKGSFREGTLPLDFSRLSTPSREFANRLFPVVPEAESCSRMEGGTSTDLLVEIPSPTEDPDRRVVIWMEGGDEPSLAFGDWHTHAGLWNEDDAIIDLVQAILADQFVLIYDVGGEHSGHCGVLDLRIEDALVEELTSKYSPGRVRIRTWSGRGDREVGVQDLR